MRRPTVVSDSGPLIALAGCNLLDLLIGVFDAIHIPNAVLLETTADQSRRGAIAIQRFAQQHAQIHDDRSDDVYLAAVNHLDEGEAQVLSLARILNCGALIDERIGRAVAKQQGIQVFGVLTVLLRAKQIGLINSIKPALLQMLANGYRISKSLVDEVLRLATE